MAQINFNSIQTSDNVTSNSVGFFQLKNDGDEAIVRFAHDSVDSFELLTTHDISLNGKFRKVNCVRNPNEPLENCPLCAGGQKISQRIFIHLIQYIKDETGKVIPLAKVWDRPVSYAYKLKNLIEEYGSLTDSVFKIKRHGAAGSRDTSYDILFCNPAMYNNEQFVKDFSAFDNYKALGSIVLNKSFEDLFTFVTTGNFPEEHKVEKENNIEYNNVNTNNVVPNTIPVSSMNTTVNTSQFAQQFGNQNFTTAQNPQAIQRPVRSYN